MFPTWRLQLRDVRRAVADGRWDEAAELLNRNSLREFLPAKQLSHDLAGRLVERAERRIVGGQSQAGWRDLNQAARLGAGDSAIAQVRSRQSQQRLQRVSADLARGDLAAARRELDKMSERNLGGHDRRVWQQVVQLVDSAMQQAHQGDFTASVGLATRALQTLPADNAMPAAEFLQSRIDLWRGAASRTQDLAAQLHAALAGAHWSDALAAANALLELAPQHSAARQARRKAWNAVGMNVTRTHYHAPQPGGARQPLRLNAWRPAASTHAHRRSAQGDTVAAEREANKRLVAWIDSVGGFLVCLGDEIVLGQPSEAGGVDVPILADLSRRHAIIRREGEAYVLSPLQSAAIDGNPVDGPTVLRDKCVIRLGASVELRFRKPHALSGTAILECLSRHRTEPAVDGIVLMSESCILGPHSHSHVRCPNWTGDLVLFRRGDELMCRSAMPVEVDGVTCIDHANVAANCRIEGDEFALSLEEV